MRSNSKFFLLVIGLILLAATVLVAVRQGYFSNQQLLVRDKVETDDSGAPTSSNSRTTSKTRSLSDALGIKKEQVAVLGGIDRPVRDFPAKAEDATDKPTKSVLPDVGKLPALKGDENPQVAGLYNELKGKDVPRAAKSALFLPEDFDKEKYLADPQAYVNKIRPGRVFEPALPGEGVTPISAASSRLTQLLQNESAILKTKTAPQSPVTYYVIDGGEFGNRLKSTTVIANDEGIAEAKYTAVSGVVGLVEILAASPLHSNQVRFTVDVKLPATE